MDMIILFLGLVVLYIFIILVSRDSAHSKFSNHNYSDKGYYGDDDDDNDGDNYEEYDANDGDGE